MNAVTFSLDAWMTLRLQHVENALDRWISAHPASASEHVAPAALLDAMRYAVLDGGKRLRPLLVMAACDAVAPEQNPEQSEAALRAACAVELIHAYSLVHDDMPCMDNDVLRRGKPTVHVKFGEASALLAGDALQALAFELLTPVDDSVPGTVQAKLCRLLARAAGSAGMAGGQAIDLASVGQTLTEHQLREMHELKTGALLLGSVLMGAHCASPDAKALTQLRAYGEAIGLAFQVVDDILDVISDSATLGKTAGKDADNNKPTYVSILGMEQSKQYAEELLANAVAALKASGLKNTEALMGLAHMVVHRVH